MIVTGKKEGRQSEGRQVKLNLMMGRLTAWMTIEKSTICNFDNQDRGVRKDVVANAVMQDT